MILCTSHVIVFCFCEQNQDYQKFKNEIIKTFGCSWPSPSVFDLGEDGKNKLVWHDYFKFKISDDLDFSWLKAPTPGSIRIDLMDKLDKFLTVGVMAEHDKVFAHFAAETPIHRNIGMFFFFFLENVFFFCPETFLFCSETFFFCFLFS